VLEVLTGRHGPFLFFSLPPFRSSLLPLYLHRPRGISFGPCRTSSPEKNLSQIEGTRLDPFAALSGLMDAALPKDQTPPPPPSSSNSLWRPRTSVHSFFCPSSKGFTQRTRPNTSLPPPSVGRPILVGHLWFLSTEENCHLGNVLTVVPLSVFHVLSSSELPMPDGFPP